jgi:flagellar FliJ protein
MEPIIRLAEQAERDAAALLRDSRRDLDECDRKLAQLRDCRRDYIEQMRAESGGSMAAARLHEMRAFVQRLDEVIHQLEDQLKRKQLTNDRQKDAWAGAKYRAQALGNVAARYRADEQKRADLKQQIEIDDRPRRPRHGDDSE